MKSGQVSIFTLAPCFSLVSLRTEGSNVLAELGLVVSCISQKLVLQELVCAPPKLRVLEEALCDEVLEDGGPALFDRGWGFLDNVHDHAVLGFADVGRVAISKLHCEDSKTPDVDLGVVPSFAFNKLRGHPADSAHLGRASISFSCQLGRVAKIS